MSKSRNLQLSESPIHNASTELYSVEMSPNKQQQLGIRRLIDILNIHLAESMNKIRVTFQDCNNLNESEKVQDYISALKEFNNSEQVFLKNNLEQIGNSQNSEQLQSNFCEINENILSMKSWKRTIFVLILKLAKICDRFSEKECCTQLFNSLRSQLQQSYLTEECEEQSSLQYSYSQQIKRLNQVLEEERQEKIQIQKLMKELQEQFQISRKAIKKSKEQYTQLQLINSQMKENIQNLTKKLETMSKQSIIQRQQSHLKLYKNIKQNSQYFCGCTKNKSYSFLNKTANHDKTLSKQKQYQTINQNIQMPNKNIAQMERLINKLDEVNEKLKSQTEKSNYYCEYIFQIQKYINKMAANKTFSQNNYIDLIQQIRIIQDKLKKMTNHIKSQQHVYSIKISPLQQIQRINTQSQNYLIDSKTTKALSKLQFSGGSSLNKPFQKKQYSYIFRQKDGKFIQKILNV